MTAPSHAQGVAARRAEQTGRIEEKLRRELGPQICGWLDDPAVIEIMLNADGALWVERLGAGMDRCGSMPAAQAESLMATVASTLRTEITRDNPILECELPLDGSRFEALLTPVVAAPTFTIRRKALAVFSLDDYVTQGVMSAPQRDRVRRAVAERHNILVVGGTSTGKTTFANAVIEEIRLASPEHRLVIIEDTAEIQCRAANKVMLRAVEGVDMTRLLKATMRLRPDRICIGEVRGPEALALLKAWNTGHPGGVATVHANDARAGLIRLEQLIAEVSPTPMPALIGEAVDLIVVIAKTPTGRRITEVVTVQGHAGPDYCLSREDFHP
ncbi:MAG TPA: P-type conjugative transfer ATPase TrbB [Patescibacteria group bacterium]|nr:P-type conjugative transfer ATPase TrbB [Patescibacteria group bacterium]